LSVRPFFSLTFCLCSYQVPFGAALGDDEEVGVGVGVEGLDAAGNRVLSAAFRVLSSPGRGVARGVGVGGADFVAILFVAVGGDVVGPGGVLVGVALEVLGVLAEVDFGRRE